MRWQDGYPCDSGSSDAADSARLAGIMKLFNHPDCNKFSITDYHRNGTFLRHPVDGNYFNGKYINFSRDQASCLFAGAISNRIILISNMGEYQPENGDIIMPSVRGHFKRCAGRKANWFQDIWLWLDVLWSCFIAPMDEPNQLICMMKVHHNKAYLKFWCKWNKQWANSIRNYWCENEGAWRGEPELAELMIKTIELDVR